MLSLMEPYSRSLISVDYSLTLEAVCCNAVLAVVTSPRNLDIFTYIAFYNNIESINGRLVSGPALRIHDFERFVSDYGPQKHAHFQRQPKEHVL